MLELQFLLLLQEVISGGRIEVNLLAGFSS